MEFETSINYKPISSFELKSQLKYDEFCEAVWNKLSEEGRQMGNAGGGEFLLDYSSFLRTEYLRCRVLQIDDRQGDTLISPRYGKGGDNTDILADSPAADTPRHNNGKALSYVIELATGSKQSRSADVIFMLLALAAVWSVGKYISTTKLIFILSSLIAVIAIALTIIALRKKSELGGIAEAIVTKLKNATLI